MVDLPTSARHWLATAIAATGVFIASPAPAQSAMARAIAKDRRAAARIAMPDRSLPIACSGYRADDNSCRLLAQVAWAGDQRRVHTMSRIGTRAILHGYWSERVVDRVHCLERAPHLSIRQAPWQRLPAEQRRALLDVARLRTSALRVPLCSFWVRRGAVVIEISYDRDGRALYPDDARSGRISLFPAARLPALKLRPWGE